MKLVEVIDRPTHTTLIYYMDFLEETVDLTPKIIDAKISLTLDKISNDDYINKLSEIGVDPNWEYGSNEIGTISTKLMSENIIIDKKITDNIEKEFIEVVVGNTTSLNGINLDLDLTTVDQESGARKLIYRLLSASNMLAQLLRYGTNKLVIVMHPHLSSIIHQGSYGLNICYNEYVPRNEVYIYQKYDANGMQDGFAIITCGGEYAVKCPRNSSSTMFKVKI